ncbi:MULTISPECIES: DUF951 domain-containing protein [unclassified Dehalobacter]|uniref:DUF951 domain-containing protein n=1 Tax=unclassified Dehalobacter TaxID=2635733 RepID=UPI000E6BB601|nr:MULTISPECIES: DUF951 domain-containing protein [unclassified Dehalobacter]RJE47369.1 hypothetical protein A7K50_01545 [Dehalobacter sp. MCB1]TCX48822.1 DUF951 domain-containing protein [Dehalobacter sp. 14DCB1]TCX56130.1 DUF951 domain-containing protein [Dehalobacter sp. 12DCB1]
MDLNVGDIVRLKKSHPCGNTEFKIMRTGMDFRIECLKCGHQTWITRAKLERNIKEILTAKNSQGILD